MYVGILYIVSIFTCALVSYLITQKQTLTSIIVVAFSATAVADFFPVATSITSSISNQEKTVGKATTAISDTKISNESASSVSSSTRPNVYFILPDMMFGSEMFEKYHIEKSILDGLKARGFNILDKAYSNAPVTEFSVPHIFTMEHFLKDGETVSTTQLHKIRNSSRETNRVVKEFNLRGYTSYAVTDGYIDMCARGDYICIRNDGNNKYQQQDIRFIERTPFFKILNVLDMKFNLFSSPMNLWPYPNRIEVPELLPRILEPKTQPYFMYIHLAIPHFPLRFDRDCNYKRFDKTEVAYAEQYYCSVKYLELLIDKIIAMDKDALIVMHADHGVMIRNQHLKQVEELSEEEIIESLSIFSAFKVPDKCNDFVENDLTPVNTFRLVFACLDDTLPQYVENKSFLVYYPKWPSGGKVRVWIH
jgi:hypothetical protein